MADIVYWRWARAGALRAVRCLTFTFYVLELGKLSVTDGGDGGLGVVGGS